MNLSDATDEDLLKAGLTSIDELKRDGPVLNPMMCWSLDGMDHQVSGPRFISEEGWYRVCLRCGSVESASKPIAL